MKWREMMICQDDRLCLGTNYLQCVSFDMQVSQIPTYACKTIKLAFAKHKCTECRLTWQSGGHILCCNYQANSHSAVHRIRPGDVKVHSHSCLRQCHWPPSSPVAPMPTVDNLNTGCPSGIPPTQRSCCWVLGGVNQHGWFVIMMNRLAARLAAERRDYLILEKADGVVRPAAKIVDI